MGFGDFLGDALSAGASALGFDGEDVDGFFDKAKTVLDGDGDAADLFSAAAEQFGGGSGDAGDVIGQLFGGGASSGGGSGGGFGAAVSEFLGGGDIGGAAQQAFGSFGSLLAGGSGGDILQSVSDQLPDSVTSAMSEAADLPFVQQVAGGDLTGLASSVPGLNGALGSFGLSTQDVESHIQSFANQAIDGGSAWSFGNMLADRGAQFLGSVAAPVDADTVMSSLPGLAQKAGVELPNWANDLDSNQLVQQGGKFLEDGGYMTAAAAPNAADPIWGASPAGGAQAPAAEASPDHLIKVAPQHDVDVTGATTVAAPASDHGLDEFDTQPASADVAPPAALHDDGMSYDMGGPDHAAAAEQPHEAVQPDIDYAPPPEQFAATDQLETDLEGLGDDAFG